MNRKAFLRGLGVAPAFLLFGAGQANAASKSWQLLNETKPTKSSESDVLELIGTNSVGENAVIFVAKSNGSIQTWIFR